LLNQKITCNKMFSWNNKQWNIYVKLN
jgi:hypothetical protein